jgi:fructokinase
MIARGTGGGRGGEILCVGELLWDALPAGLFLGGAPFNVACHLRAAGLPVAMVSRVGADQLGDEALRRLQWYGVGADLVQVDATLPTGLVRVAVDDAGDARYDIVAPAAWDAIAPSEALLGRAAAARAIVFGTLAQRADPSRRTIERLWETGALRVLDVNLRPPYDDAGVVRRSLRHADVVKMNGEELRRLAGWLGLRGSEREMAAALAASVGCRTVCVTRGRDGAALWRDGRWREHPGFEVEVRDTVGAGDAFLAVLLAGLLSGADDETILRNANLIGAYVVTQFGAVPADQPPATPAALERLIAADGAAAAPTPAGARERRSRGTPPAPRRPRSGG